MDAAVIGKQVGQMVAGMLALFQELVQDATLRHQFAAGLRRIAPMEPQVVDVPVEPKDDDPEG